MNIRKKIMLKIYLIWLFRKVTPVVLFEVLFMVLALHLFSGAVFVARVAQNASIVLLDNPLRLIPFFISAFIATKFAVKLEILTMLILAFYMLKSLKKAVVSYELIRRSRVQR